MDITNVSAPIAPATTAAAGNATPQAGSTDQLANKEVFLQMLVAQIKNQDPLHPTDGAQFMTQLAQFSQLEQLIGIRGDLAAIKPAATGAGSNSANPVTNPA